MELTRCSVYPALDLAEDDTDTDGIEDMRIRPHDFDLPNVSKCSLKKKFVPLSKPNEVQKKCVSVQPDFFCVNESKFMVFVKLGIFDEKKKALLVKVKIFE